MNPNLGHLDWAIIIFYLLCFGIVRQVSLTLLRPKFAPEGPQKPCWPQPLDTLAVRYGEAPDGSGGTRSKPITRYAWVTRLKPDKIEHYEYLHAHPWPAVNRMIKECHIQNYSIYKREIEGKTYLFSYLEYSGDDFEADLKRMAADPETRRWWQETDPCQQPLPDAVAQGKIWSDATEVFHLD